MFGHQSQLLPCVFLSLLVRQNRSTYQKVERMEHKERQGKKGQKKEKKNKWQGSNIYGRSRNRMQLATAAVRVSLDFYLLPIEFKSMRYKAELNWTEPDSDRTGKTISVHICKRKIFTVAFYFVLRFIFVCVSVCSSFTLFVVCFVVHYLAITCLKMLLFLSINAIEETRF